MRCIFLCWYISFNVEKLRVECINHQICENWGKVSPDMLELNRYTLDKNYTILFQLKSGLMFFVSFLSISIIRIFIICRLKGGLTVAWKEPSGMFALFLTIYSKVVPMFIKMTVLAQQICVWFVMCAFIHVIVSSVNLLVSVKIFCPSTGF